MPDSTQNDTPYGSSVVSFEADKSGRIIGQYVYYNGVQASVRPTFNLKTNVMYKSGTGTSSDPYRIMIN